MQTQKKMREAQLEPQQKHTEKILTKMDATKGHMETLKLKAEEMMREYIIAQNVEFVVDKGAQENMGERERLRERERERDKGRNIE